MMLVKVLSVFISILAVAKSGVINGEPKDQGCVVDGKTIKVGEHHPIPHACVANICIEGGEFATSACGFIYIPENWTLVNEDPSKPYPKCCAHGVPPLNLVPDVLDHVEYDELLEITYDGDKKVYLAEELTPTKVKNQPKVSYSSAAKDSHYILVMTDPDAPNFLHWLVGNIPGDDVEAGEVLAGYIGSGPPKDSGLHRYVFLMFKQPDRLNFDEPRVNTTTVAHRADFSVRKLVGKYSLGDPVALNAYKAQYDDYVPELYKQLGL